MLIAATMRDARPYVAEQPFSLYIAGFPVVAAAFDPRCSRAIPCLERVGIVLPHLLLGGKAITELVEHQISVDG
ncbi:hypothetical protein [Bradyrhizobium guangzhouense]|uniref:hypothetical protein n=1 Tax=Bradyrhizobium guangzhouense TaxID=1325095 RepID=UPI0019D6FDC0|nr:hypothetical protein [Bradyrhizobium guangzhouense]